MGTHHSWLLGGGTLAPWQVLKFQFPMCYFLRVLGVGRDYPGPLTPSLWPAHVHSLNMPVLPTGWGERSWEVHYAKAAHGGPGPCPRYQACPQVRDAPTPTHRELHALSAHSQLPLPLHSRAFSFHFASRNLKIGYFSQHHVEQLDLNVSAVELLARKFPGTLG